MTTGLRLGGRSINRYDLYELAAQSPRQYAAFLEALHRAGGGVGAAGVGLVLAEDFCGPASIARAWLTLGEDHRAIAVDRDPEPLEHAEDRLSREMGGAALTRFTTINEDVLSARYRADVIAALNFAVCELHTRAALMTYLRHILLRLEARGVLVLDLYAGASAMMPGVTEQTIETDDGEILYTWDQRDADPLTGMVVNTMSFRLPDGSEVPDAFVYRWRLWSVPEVRDAMREAGFASTEVHTSLGGAIDETGRLLVHPASADADPESEALDDEELESFVAYVVGRV